MHRWVGRTMSLPPTQHLSHPGAACVHILGTVIVVGGGEKKSERAIIHIANAYRHSPHSPPLSSPSKTPPTPKTPIAGSSQEHTGKRLVREEQERDG